MKKKPDPILGVPFTYATTGQLLHALMNDTDPPKGTHAEIVRRMERRGYELGHADESVLADIVLEIMAWRMAHDADAKLETLAETTRMGRHDAE